MGCFVNSPKSNCPTIILLPGLFFKEGLLLLLQSKNHLAGRPAAESHHHFVTNCCKMKNSVIIFEDDFFLPWVQSSRAFWLGRHVSVSPSSHYSF
jgi:hypothetical protein